MEYITYSAAFSPAGDTLALGGGYSSSLGGRSEITLWDARTLACRNTLSARGGEVDELAFTPDGANIAAQDYGVDVWDLASGKRKFRNLARGGSAGALAVSPDGKWLAAASFIRFPRWPTSKDFAQQAEVGAGKKEASAESKVVISDIHTGKEVLVLEKRKEPIVGLAFSPDGKTLAVGDLEGEMVRLWNVPSWKERLSFRPSGDIWLIRFAPDGKTLFVKGSFFSPGTFYDAEDGAKCIVLKGDQEQICDAAFSPDGKTLAMGSDVLKLWDTQTGELIHVWKPPPRSNAPSNDVTAVAFSPDGRMLVTGTLDGKVTIWDVAPSD